MDAETLSDLLTQLAQLGTTHKWLPLAILVMSWGTALTNNWSRFPVTVPTRYQPLVVLVMGQVYGMLEAVLGGASWKNAVVSGLVASVGTMGAYDVVMKALFNGQVPPWLAWLAAAKTPPPAPEDPPKTE